MSIRTVTVTVDAYKRDMSESLKSLRDDLSFDVTMGNVSDETVAAFNNLACCINSFMCVSMPGVDGFGDLSGEIDDIEMIEGES